VKEKIPFFLLSALASLITLYAQDKGGAMKSLEPFLSHFASRTPSSPTQNTLAKRSGLVTLQLFTHSPIASAVASSWFISATASHFYGRGTLQAALSLPSGRLVLVPCYPRPVIGLIQVGGQSMADRYTYIPLTGLFMICSWGISDLLRSWRYRGAVLAILAGLVICASTVVTWQQLSYWKENIPSISIPFK